MRRRIISILLIACVVAGIGAAQVIRSENGKSAEQTVTDQPIASGSMYEITENNFVKGLDHDFTPEEQGRIRTQRQIPSGSVVVC